MINPEKTMNRGEANEAIVRAYAVLHGSFPLVGGGLKEFSKIRLVEEGELIPCRGADETIFYEGKKITVAEARKIHKGFFDLEKFKVGKGNFKMPGLISMMNALGIPEFKSPSKRAYDLITVNKGGGESALKVEGVDASAPSFGNASTHTQVLFQIVRKDRKPFTEKDRTFVMGAQKNTKLKAKGLVAYLMENGYELEYIGYRDEIFEMNLGLTGAKLLGYVLQLFLENFDLSRLSKILERLAQEKERFGVAYSDKVIYRKVGESLRRWWDNGKASQEWDLQNNKGCGGIVLKWPTGIECIPDESGKWESRLIEAGYLTSPSTGRHLCKIVEKDGLFIYPFSILVRGTAKKLIEGSSDA